MIKEVKDKDPIMPKKKSNWAKWLSPKARDRPRCYDSL